MSGRCEVVCERAELRTQLDIALAEAKRLREALERIQIGLADERPEAEDFGAQVPNIIAVALAPHPAPEAEAADFIREWDALGDTPGALAATGKEPDDEEHIEQCPSHSAGLQCCNFEGHAGDHEWRTGPLDNLRRVTWPGEPKR